MAAALALLLSKGGDASARDKDGLTALAHAARAGNEAAVTALLDAAPATLEQPTADVARRRSSSRRRRGTRRRRTRSSAA